MYVLLLLYIRVKGVFTSSDIIPHGILKYYGVPLWMIFGDVFGTMFPPSIFKE